MNWFRSIFSAILASILLGGCATLGNRLEKTGFLACDDQKLHANLSDSLCIETSVNHGNLTDEPVKLFVRKFPARGEHQGENWLIAGGPVSPVPVFTLT
tara:strand:- start:456 stop:752 length:297 start_codon:yes stop_codon:yes gene_type:complete